MSLTFSGLLVSDLVVGNYYKYHIYSLPDRLVFYFFKAGTNPIAFEPDFIHRGLILTHLLIR